MDRNLQIGTAVSAPIAASNCSHSTANFILSYAVNLDKTGYAVRESVEDD